MRRLSVFIALIVILTMVAPSFAKSPAAQDPGSSIAAQDSGTTDVYLVIMFDDPAVAFEGGITGLQATRPARGAKIDADSAAVKNYVGHLKTRHNQALEAVGARTENKIHDYTYAINGFAAQLTAGQAAALEKQPGVMRVVPDELKQPTTDSSPGFLGLTLRGGPWATGITGEGVVVGIIDSGIWPEHPSFADDGSYGPPPVTLEDTPDNPACEFGNTAHNPNDVPFTCNNKLIGARQMMSTYRAIIGAAPDEFDSARDDDGHGTHTASTAAGNGGVAASIFGIPRGTISGIAPQSHVLAYKSCGLLGCFTSDTAAAIDQAVVDGVDVLNYSIGGGASLLGLDDIAFLFAADAGLYVATSAGNSGPGPGTIGGPASVPWLTSVGANTQKRFFEGMIELNNGDRYFGASITDGLSERPLVDAEFAGGDLCVPGTLDASMVAGKIVLCRRGAIARASKSLAVFQAGGVGMIMYENSDDNNLFSDSHWVPSVHIDQTPGLAIKNYIATAGSPRARIRGGRDGAWPAAPSMTYFSSRGPDPVAEDIIKPDVTAPGIHILAGNSPLPAIDYQVPGELFQAIAGTSMSSPHVAGVFALIKQVHPDWSPAAAKSALMTTAFQHVLDNDRVSMANPFGKGAGHINPGGRVTFGSLYQPGLVYDAGFLDYLGFLCDAAPEAFADPAGTCAALESLGVPTDPSDLNLASIGIAELPGKQTVVRTVTSVAKENEWRKYSVSVDPPPGYDVTVSPSNIRLKGGMSATYEVTFMNTGAPVGEWRFGSLTWSDRGGRYDVYSPIAVRGSLLNAPAELMAAGTEGALSFDIQFGYTGDYTAAPHGLEDTVLIMDNVLQDPDQDFDPGDVATGGANVHEFNLSGAALLRVALPPESTEAGADLDVFVYDPNGDFVASSTLGGTDELVDIVLPMDGTWKVYVHGWLTPGGDSDYTMYSWVISATPGGNLSVDAAPASAVLGETGAVDVSWSGLTAGSKHLGAVSHSGPTGLMGLTLISVDTE